MAISPKLTYSGDGPQDLGVTKGENNYFRWLLVQAAQYMLSRLAPDSRLRRWGILEKHFELLGMTRSQRGGR